jgi:hypothetical protein
MPVSYFVFKSLIQQIAKAALNFQGAELPQTRFQGYLPFFGIINSIRFIFFQKMRLHGLSIWLLSFDKNC